MYIRNFTSNYYYLAGGVKIPPGVEGQDSLFVDSGLYLGNSTLFNQINNLEANGSIALDDLPEEEPVEQILSSSNFTVNKHNLILDDNGAAAGMSLENTPEGENYGSFRTKSTGGNEAGIRASREADLAMIFAHKMTDDPQKHFEPTIDGFRLILNASTSEISDIVDVLVDLGLVDAE